VTAINFVEPELHWMSFIVTPPFPDYVSGTARSAVPRDCARAFLWHRRLPFTIGSDFLPEYTAAFTCLDAAEEAAVSVSMVAFTFDRQTRMDCKRAQHRRMGCYSLPHPKEIAREGTVKDLQAPDTLLSWAKSKDSK